MIAGITPIYKDKEQIFKERYRPVSILKSVSKIFEKTIYAQLYEYISKYMSDYLCGMICMIEKWKKAVDQKKVAGGLLTDLSKAFDCLNHELLIAELTAYGLAVAHLVLLYWVDHLLNSFL